jgi:DUF4097 and DUF4098 domain-containing protein YvlB
MSRRVYFSVSILILAAATLIAGQLRAEERLMKTFQVSPGQTLYFDMRDGGGLTMEGWDRNTAEVTISDGPDDLDDFRIELKTTAKGLKIWAERRVDREHNYSPHFHVKVPRSFNLDFETMGGGLELINLEGTFTGETMGGRLALERVKGDVKLETMGGRIVVVDCDVDGKISTGGGRVLLENVVGDLRATSGGGNVQYINVRGRDGEIRSPGGSIDAPINQKTVLITSAGGTIDVDDAPAGASIETGGGDIRVRNASKFVEAWTGGGDVDIRISSGWVKVFTGAGDIDIEVGELSREGDGDIEVFTGTGDISVTVPKGFSMELDLDIGYTRSSKRDYRITTNLDLDEERTKDWDYTQGTPRKHIYGVGSFGGGRSKITVRTTNGNIRIHEE